MQCAAVTMSGVHETVERVLPRILAWIRRAADAGTDVVFFPELILGHYHMDPIAMEGPEVEAIRESARALSVGVGIGIGEQQGKDLYSSYALCGADGLLSVHRKTRWQTDRCPINLGTTAVAHKFVGLKVGIMICSETRFPDVAQSLALRGAELLIMPHAYGVGGPNWKPLRVSLSDTVAARCREAALSAVVVAATGENMEGGYAIVNAEGDIIVQRLEQDEQLHLFSILVTDKVTLSTIA